LRPRLSLVLLTAAASLTGAESAHADRDMPPWTDPGDLPLASWMKSVVTQKLETPIFAVPGKLDTRRGTMMQTARLPLYGAKRGPNCGGRWLLVGPLAWICSDSAEPSPDPPWSVKERDRWAAMPQSDGLPFRYHVVGRDGAFGFADLKQALDDAPAQEYEAGFIVGVTEERSAHGERWVKTPHNRWIAAKELAPLHPSLFHGEEITGDRAALDFAWVVAERATTRRGPKPSDAAVGTRVRFQRIPWREERGTMVRVSEDGASPEEWMAARELAHPTMVERPTDVADGERWIDVELANQTLVAYEGTRPLYATLVSTGRGPEKSETATPKGTHRVWVKLATTDMDNLEREDAERRYSIEDVPYVQFFDKAVALHAAFWHKDYGRVHSHGCVNLAPLDAQWLFGFTRPHLPAGWSAAFPTALEPGTAVRVR
jgi:hypothetical protein